MSEFLPPSRKLPPTDRDFEIYESVHIENGSILQMAERHRISKTRVRQIVRRVVEWLGEVLPPQAKVAKEQELYLARQIAADRFQHQLERVTWLWEETLEPKYAGIRIRLTNAQARLGVVVGVAAGLAADAIEGIEVPAYVPPPETQARSASEGPSRDETFHPNAAPAVGRGSPDPAQDPTEGLPDEPASEPNPKPQPDKHTKEELRELQRQYPWLFCGLGYCEITAEMIAIAESVGLPFSPKLIQDLYDQGYLPRPGTSPLGCDETEAVNVGRGSPDPAPVPTAGPPSPSNDSHTGYRFRT